MVVNENLYKRTNVLKTISDDLQRFGKISLAVSGSVAYERVNANSDIDLIIIIPAKDLSDLLLTPLFKKYFFCHARSKKIIMDFEREHIDAFSVNGMTRDIKLSAFIYSIQSFQKLLFRKVDTIKISKKYQFSKIKNKWYSRDSTGKLHSFRGPYAVTDDAFLLTRKLILFFAKTFCWGPDFDRIFMSKFLVDGHNVTTMIQDALGSLMKFYNHENIDQYEIETMFLNRFYKVRYFSESIKKHILSRLY